MVKMIQQTDLNTEDKKMIESSLILGKIADDGPNLPRLGDTLEKSITYRGQSVVIYLQALSKEPEYLQTILGKSSTDVYISFDEKNRRYLERYGYFKEEDKLTFLREHFKDRLILFKPMINYSNERYHYNYEIILDEKIDLKEMGHVNYFTQIPTYSRQSHQMFESKLMNAKPIELISYNHSMDIPEFIICGDYLYKIGDEEVLRKYQANDTLYICDKPEGIVRIPKPEGFDQYLKLSHRDISFASLEITKTWIDDCNKFGVSISKIVAKRLFSPQQEKSEKEKDQQQIQVRKLEEPNTSAMVSENDFINRLEFLVKKKKLRYVADDLYNVHTSLKTSNFTILGGMSGTGKTELAMLYAEALKLTAGENLLFIPVRPSFTEPSDLLGFLNQQTGVFHESEIGLVSFLYKAAHRNPDKMHMVLFDEMNLGQVEHYFSDFISILELEKDKRILRLFNKDTNCVQHHLKDGIPIGANVLFVGTANFDETTRDFSNRMLDRSNVIILEKMSFLEAQKYEAEEIDSIEAYENKEKTTIHNPDKDITATNFNTWIHGKKLLAPLEENELSILEKLHEEISSYDSQTGVSFRIAKQIAHYLENVPRDEEGNTFLERKTAFDYQIKQRILSKIRGHREQIESLVGQYDEEYCHGRLSIILSDDKFTGEKSIAYLKQKAKELKRNGYTL